MFLSFRALWGRVLELLLDAADEFPSDWWTCQREEALSWWWLESDVWFGMVWVAEIGCGSAGEGWSG